MATKSAKRRAAREARFSPPPPPEQTTAMAASGMDVNRGNSDQVPLSDKGADEIQDTAAKLAARGGIDKAIVSTSVRGQQTADAIHAAHPQMERVNDPNVESWPQGNLEGKPAKLVKDQIRE